VIDIFAHLGVSMAVTSTANSTQIDQFCLIATANALCTFLGLFHESEQIYPVRWNELLVRVLICVDEQWAQFIYLL